MIRRTTATLFLLIANIILLAHAVVHHHHHEGLICFENTHCQSECDLFDFDADHHHHDKEHLDDTCNLKQAVVIPSNQVDLICKFIIAPDHFESSHWLQVFLIDNDYNPLLPTFLDGSPPPVLNSNYSCIISSIKGLRAPPVV